ncbi:hypothetical protein SDC9_185955 [bioreactor metagenome]|uniref:Uncharacterized protein n=1 Tax=bioreactor metagenome TaxID=1076179 RepID=A0A645HHD1_9ZZZZ
MPGLFNDFFNIDITGSKRHCANPLQTVQLLLHFSGVIESINALDAFPTTAFIQF